LGDPAKGTNSERIGSGSGLQVRALQLQGPTHVLLGNLSHDLKLARRSRNSDRDDRIIRIVGDDLKRDVTRRPH
jgi:hypothetical protein